MQIDHSAQAGVESASTVWSTVHVAIKINATKMVLFLSATSFSEQFSNDFKNLLIMERQLCNTCLVGQATRVAHCRDIHVPYTYISHVSLIT